MDFDIHYSNEQEAYRREVRGWIATHLTTDIQAPVNALDLDWDQLQTNRQFLRRLGEKGWYAPEWPAAYGGGGLSQDLALVVYEELAKIPNYHNLKVPGDIGSSVAAALLSVGTDEQRRRFLPPILRAEWAVWELYTEPEAGSDLPGLKTTAVRNGDEYLVNGSKTFVGGIFHPDYFFLLAKTDPVGERQKNLSVFLIPHPAEGMQIESLDLIGGSGKRTIFLEDVRVSANQMVGKEGDGWLAFIASHGPSPATLVDGHRHMEIALDLWRQRDRVGLDPLEEAVRRDLLVETYIDQRVNQLFRKRNYAMGLNAASIPYSDGTYHGSQYMRRWKLSGLRFGEMMVRIFGPATLLTEPDYAPAETHLEWAHREGIIMAHPGGTVEVQAIRVFRGLIGRSKGMRG